MDSLVTTGLQSHLPPARGI
uniref:Uncharacterized protein n=1 Tax=Anguilla anguilla TaxID=7936 RepID=A0A0E9U3M5_ANGAN